MDLRSHRELTTTREYLVAMATVNSRARSGCNGFRSADHNGEACPSSHEQPRTSATSCAVPHGSSRSACPYLRVALPLRVSRIVTASISVPARSLVADSAVQLHDCQILVVVDVLADWNPVCPRLDLSAS